MMHRTGTRSLVALAVAAVALAGAAPEARAAEGDTETKWGSFAVGLRYRFELVSDDNPSFDDDAYASTLRTTLLYRTPRWKDFDVYVQFEDVSDLGAADRHANGGAGSLSNGVTDRPPIPDPDATELNQVAVRWRGLPEATLEVGRLEVALGTQRFVGPVGWRQNHQTLDAFRVVHTPVDFVTWTYLFVDNVNRVNGGNHAVAGHLFNAAVRILDAGTLTPYVYALDYDDPAQFGLSTTTYGLRWQGTCGLPGEWRLPYHVELAQQDDAGDNPASVDAGYYNVEVGAALSNVWLKLAYEVLEGSAADGRFQTPLATLHKFNGWADKFLSTPATGLQDLWVAAGGKIGPVAVEGRFHDFSSDSGSLDYGQELDVQATWKAPWKQQFAVALAAYDADDFDFDTVKAWVWTSFAF